MKCDATKLLNVVIDEAPRRCLLACSREAGHVGMHYCAAHYAAWDDEPRQAVPPYDWEAGYREEIAGLRAAIGALLPYAEERTTSATAAAARRFALAMLAATRSPE